MTTNFPGPYGLRFFYTVDSLDHKQEFNIDLDADPTPGDAFNLMDAIVRGPLVTTKNLQDVVDDWVTLWATRYNDTTAEMTRAELWKYTPMSFNAAYISSYDIGENGTAAGATVLNSEVIYTFRTVEGGVTRIHFEDTISTPGPSLTYTMLTASQQAIVDAVLGSENAWLGRDTSQPLAFLQAHPGQNEKLFKIRNR